MHSLGRTRSSQQPNHLLLTPDTFVRTALPGMKGCVAVVHVGPALGARFAQYTAEFDAGGELGATPVQRFVFVMEGAVRLDAQPMSSELAVGGYAYLPQGFAHRVTALQPSRLAVIEKPYVALDAVGAPQPPPAPATQVPPAANKTYVVQFGDTLFKIAVRNHVTVAALAQANGITNTNLVYVGQRLIIP